MAAGWSSLPVPGDLVGDRLLATNDLDSYMDFRAVCHGWRASTADPRRSPHLGDPRFQPCQWLMLDEGCEAYDDEEVHQSDDGARLFVNTATGRFVRRDLSPALRSHFLVAGAGGRALVLADRIRPHAARLFNPFTGSLIRFEAPVPPHLNKKNVAAHVIRGSSAPTLVLLRGDCADTTVYWADPSSERFVVLQDNCYNYRLARKALAGGIYAAGGGLEGGSRPPASLLHPTVSKIMGLLKLKTKPPFVTKDFRRFAGGRLAWNNCSLVESEGEVFVEVFKMVTRSGDSKLEPVRNIGSRAIFVGACRSLSVDAGKFASVQPNCVYYTHSSSSYSYHVCRLQDGKKKRIGGACCTFGSKEACARVVELLCRYTSAVEKYRIRV
ncbi:unnamed protein product [Urochloa decumbens]|uniref:KIB1-4 beta-propeller domain-containing protein n=1 Tax=Urochloa decumbens TaxID=240449 RepID=A0ABC8VHY7_9POAL